MARPAYIMLCQSASIEPGTNRISFFHAVEGINFAPSVTDLPLPPNAAAFTTPYLTTAWLKEEGDTPDVLFESDMICKTPSGKPLFMAPPTQFSFAEDINVHRFMAPNVPFGGSPESGIHTIEARLRRVGQQEWTVHQSYAFHVNIVHPKPVSATATTQSKE